MTVNNNNNNNNNTDIQFTDIESINTLKIPKSLIDKLSPNQKKLVETLATNHPHGLLSSELTREIAVSNKSDLIHFKLRMLLASEGLEIYTQRISRQWLWKLRPIQSLEIME